MFPPAPYIIPSKVLPGHLDFLAQKENKKLPPIHPVIIQGYPFGGGLRCPMRIWLEVTDNPVNIVKGRILRHMTQTPFKDYCVLYSDWIQQFGLNGAIDLAQKNPPERWNKPHPSTYFLWGCLYEAEYKYVPQAEGKAGKIITEYFAFTMSTPLVDLYNFLKWMNEVSNIGFMPTEQGVLLHQALDFVMAVSGGSLSRRLSGWTANYGFSGFKTERDHFLHLLCKIPGQMSKHIVDAIAEK